MAEEAERHWHALLVVEDESDTRDAIANLFDFNACTVRVARDGYQAMAHLRDGYRPCLILLDLSMPGTDGVAFRNEQRMFADCAGIPVVIVSGREDGQDVSRALGASAFVQKPVGLTTLLAAVERHCGQARS